MTRLIWILALALASPFLVCACGSGDSSVASDPIEAAQADDVASRGVGDVAADAADAASEMAEGAGDMAEGAAEAAGDAAAGALDATGDLAEAAGEMAHDAADTMAADEAASDDTEDAVDSALE